MIKRRSGWHTQDRLGVPPIAIRMLNGMGYWGRVFFWLVDSLLAIA